MFFKRIIEFSASIVTLFSLINIYKKYKINKKNKISDYKFTDRVDDINKILSMLNTEKRIIALIGTNDIQGKTWLSKKICDCINHRHVRLEYNIKRTRNKKAIYFDLKEKNISNVREELLNTSVYSNPLYIFDHCNQEDINIIYNDSLNIKFSAIIIPHSSNIIDINFIEKYQLTPFPIKKVNELQNKIIEHYKKIDSLSKDEISVLYELTNGNIKNISFMLSSQKSVLWIKQISKQEQTDYDLELNKIQILLFGGLYKQAKLKIEQLLKKDKDYIYSNNDYFSKITLLDADCEHLLNNYQEAIDKISILLSPTYNKYNINQIFQLKLAHFYKHIWESDVSISLLEEIMNSNIDSTLEILGILSCKYFIDEKISNYHNMNTIELYRMLIERESRKNSSQPLRLERHKIIIDFYDNKDTFKNLISRIDSVISNYQFENNRLIANATFIKGEIYRLHKNYDKAIACYDKALTYTDDDNIKIQVNIMLHYLRKINKIDIDIDYMNENEIRELCHSHNNKYGTILMRKINNIILQDPDYKEIINCFETRIMTIL